MVKIKQLYVEDLESIRSVACVAFPETYKEMLSAEQIDYMMDMMYSAESIKKQFADGVEYYMAYNNEEPIGYISIEQEREDFVHLHKLYVLPTAQGLGVGKMLFNHILDVIKARQSSSCSIQLSVNRDNKAQYFYKKLGLKVIHEEDYPIGNGFYKTDYIMEYVLN